MNIAKFTGSVEITAAIQEAIEKFKIVRVDHFLAQMYVESAGFQRTKENLNYSAARLLAVFPGRNGMHTFDQAAAVVARGHDAIAEQVYGIPWGKRALGNTEPGDGAKFIGRGFKQLTGRDNYTRYSRDTYGDMRCVDQPQLLERLPDAAMSAGWFWQVNVLDLLGDNVRAITRRVNGGVNGLAARMDALERVRALT